MTTHDPSDNQVLSKCRKLRPHTTGRVISYDSVTATRVVSYDPVTTNRVVTYDPVATTRVVSYNFVMTTRVVSYDLVTTLTDDSLLLSPSFHRLQEVLTGITSSNPHPALPALAGAYELSGNL